MSYFAPNNFAEVSRGIESGHSFHSTRLGIRAESIWVLSDARRELTGHRDDFANKIIELVDARKSRYLAIGNNRVDSAESFDPVYVVVRDGNALAYIERGGTLHIAPGIESALPKYAKTVERIRAALETLAAKVPESETWRY